MAEDEVGFVYPEIDQNLCVGCGACKKACGYQAQPLMQKSEAVYAAASNNDNLLRKSASGGAFAVLAENVLKKDGVVYGAALPLENGKLEPKHLRIDTVEQNFNCGLCDCMCRCCGFFCCTDSCAAVFKYY